MNSSYFSAFTKERMQRWCGKIAVVTGASAGIGASIVKELACNGLIVVGMARRKERVEDLAKEVGNKGKVHAVKCNVTDEKEVAHAFEWIEKNLGPVSVLVNNAGLSRSVNFQGKGEITEWRDILNTNIMGMSMCTRYTLQNMLKHKIDGQFININSIAGHNKVSSGWVDMGMYFASKHAVTVLTDALRKEVATHKTKIRVASISPGLVKTDIIQASGDKELIEADVYNKMPALEPEHISGGVLYILSTPTVVNVSELTIQPTGETI